MGRCLFLREVKTSVSLNISANVFIKVTGIKIPLQITWLNDRNHFVLGLPTWKEDADFYTGLDQ